MKLIIINKIKVANIVFLILVILSGLTVSNMSKASELDDRALPILNLLKAIKYQDKQLLLSVYSKKIRPHFLGTDGDEKLKRFKIGIDKMIPFEYEMHEVKYEMNNSGVIIFKIKGVKIPPLSTIQVTKENGVWKVNE